MELEWWKARREDDRARDKQSQDFQVKILGIEAKEGVDIEEKRAYAQADAWRTQSEIDIKREEANARIEALRAKPQQGEAQ
jgi:hypothetical protein